MYSKFLHACARAHIHFTYILHIYISAFNNINKEINISGTLSMLLKIMHCYR